MFEALGLTVVILGVAAVALHASGLVKFSVDIEVKKK